MYRALFHRQTAGSSLACAGARCLFSTTATLHDAGVSAALQPVIYTSRYPSIKPIVAGETTLYGYMMKRLRSHDPNKVGAVEADTAREYTFAELIATTERVAQVLYHAGGVRKGDVVALCTLNTAVYGSLIYGVLRLGATVSLVNPTIQADSLAYHFKTGNAKVILGAKAYAGDIAKAADIVSRERSHPVQVLYPEDFLKLSDRLDIPTDYQPLTDAKPDDTVFLPFSSGTTGLPKGVQLTNSSLIHNTEQSKASLGVTRDDTTLMVLPLFHIYGVSVGCNAFMSAGATQVVMKQYNVLEYARLIAKYRVTFNLVAPPVFVSLVKHYDAYKHYDMSSLRAFISGAAPLGGEVEGLFHHRFPHVAVGQAFGTTETSPLLLGPRWAPGKEEAPMSGAAGAILPDTEVRFVKVDDSQQSSADKSRGIDCAPGEEGEMWVRGPQMMKGYLKQSDTDAAMQDGWYRTGDIGVYDPESGYITITDRLKELIKYKGFQVSPASLEATLLLHPWVADCLVVGVPDPRDVSFEMPRALVVLKKDLPMQDVVRASDSIFHYTMARNPPHKRLHGGVRIVDEIPRNAAGKVLRRLARVQEVAYMEQQVRHGEEPAVAASQSRRADQAPPSKEPREGEPTPSTAAYMRVGAAGVAQASARAAA